MRCTPCVLVAAAFLVACGAETKPAAAPRVSTMVRIPEATPDQLHDFDSDKSRPPVAEAKTRRTETRTSETRRQIDLDDSARQVWQGSAAVGGPDCDSAALCCEHVMQKNGSSPPSQKVCDSLRTAPTASCQQLLASFRQAFGKLGVKCP